MQERNAALSAKENIHRLWQDKRCRDRKLLGMNACSSEVFEQNV